MRTITLLIFLFLSVTALADEYTYERIYKAGENYKYKLEWWSVVNGHLLSDYASTAISNHLSTDAEERITWDNFVEVGPNDVETDLTELARKVNPFELSLRPYAGIQLPPLTVPEMVGPITDLVTFYVALSPTTGSGYVSSVNDEYTNPNLARGVWSDGSSVLVGEDCTQIKVKLVDLTQTTATYETTFNPPEKECIKMKTTWMEAPVNESLNNFQQVVRTSTGRVSALWGEEFFRIRTEVARDSGIILKARMYNKLQLKMRDNCDDSLENCGPVSDTRLVRHLNLNLIR